MSVSEADSSVTGSRPRWVKAWPVAASAALPLILFFIVGRIGLDLADEGFLWYGAQRLVAGDLPLRDFQAYDIGRYFWSAAWMLVTGSEGVMALRLGNAVLGAATVGLGIWIVRTAKPSASPAYLLACAAIFTAWLAPAYKVADSFATVLLLAGAVNVLQRTTPRRWIVLGVCLGIAACIGINHALYGSIATLMLLIYTRGAPHPGRAVCSLAAGGLIGYSPVLALAVLAPGFAAAFLESILEIVGAGTTNIALPLPSVTGIARGEDRGWLAAAGESLMALLFLGAPLAWASAAWRLRTSLGRRVACSAIVGGLILSVPYAHYVLSRADPAHLAISILPPLLAMFAWASLAPRRTRAAVLVIAAAATFVLTAGLHPAYQLLRGRPFDPVAVLGDRVLAPEPVAVQARLAAALARAQPPGPIYVAPYLPGAYAVIRQRSPSWEIYLLFPASPEEQQQEIGRLAAAGVQKALIGLEHVDDRPDLGFQRTHPLIANYLSRCLPRRISMAGLPPTTTVRAGAGAPCESPGAAVAPGGVR